MPVIIPRVPWPTDFPDVVIHSDMPHRNNHAFYAAAKAGDAEAAKTLVQDLLSADGIAQVSGLLSGRPAIFIPVVADEVSGFNAIPDAMAQEIANRLGLMALAGTIVQANKVGHTRADGWHRLVTPAVFSGDVEEHANTILVDDHVGFGGTLANLRGYIEQRGGHVLGMTTLTETRAARKIAVRAETLTMLQDRHGEELNHFWFEEFGHTVDCLTDIEAGYLCRVESVAAIKNRMAQAAELARGRGFSAVGLGPRP